MGFGEGEADPSFLPFRSQDALSHFQGHYGEDQALQDAQEHARTCTYLSIISLLQRFAVGLLRPDFSPPSLPSSSLFCLLRKDASSTATWTPCKLSPRSSLPPL